LSHLLVATLAELGRDLPQGSTLGQMAALLAGSEKQASIARRLGRSPQYLWRVRQRLSRLVLDVLLKKGDTDSFPEL